MTIARRGRLTLDRVLADAAAGIFDDRLDAFMPSGLYGPPTDAECAAAARQRATPSRPSPARHRERRGDSEKRPGAERAPPGLPIWDARRPSGAG
jgi:hypothetical protein